MEIGDGFYSLEIILNVEFFVGRMKVIAVQAKPHEYNFNTQLLFQDGTDGNAAAPPHRDRLFAKGGFNGPACCQVSRTAYGGQVRFPPVVFEGFHRDTGWSDGSEIVQKHTRNFF